jgi:hypothetical protein
LSKLENKPLTKLLGPFFQENCLKQPENKYFMLVFFYFGVTQAPPNRPKKVPKGLQVGRTYGPMSKLKRKAPNQIIRPIHLREMVRNNQKTFFCFVFFSLGSFGHPQMDPKRYQKAHKWAGGMAQCLSLNISP